MAYFNINDFLGKIDQHGFQRSTQFRCRIPVRLIGAGVGMVGPALGLGGDIASRYPDACKWLEEGLLCEQTSTPSRDLDTVSLGIYGLEEKYPVFTTYTDHRCTFLAPLVERNGKQYNDVATIFHEWQNSIQRRTYSDGNGASMVMKFPDEYRLTQGMQLDQFSAYNTKRRGDILGVNVNAQGNVRDVIQNVNRVTSLFSNKHQIPSEWTNRNNSDEDDSTPSLSYRFFNVFPKLVESSALAWNGISDIQKVTVSFTYSYWNTVGDGAVPWISVDESHRLEHGGIDMWGE